MSPSTNALKNMKPGHYEIRIKEPIADKWLTWFDEFSITCTDSGETLRTGPIADQSALHGLLAKIRDLNLTLISINCLEKAETKTTKPHSGITEPKPSNHSILIAAWIFVLSVSDLPYILFTYLGIDPASLPTLKLVLLAIYLILCWMFQLIRPLWQFAFVFLVFQLANIRFDWIFFSDSWQARFNGTDATFTTYYLSLHALDILRALLVIAALWIVKRNRADFYLVKGQWDAPIDPVRWLGIKAGESWRVFGWIFAACAGLAILIPLAFSVPLTMDAFSRALPYLPIAMVLAAMNAFAEETYFRASLLSTLANVIGKNQALLLNCLFFGLGHYFGGSPPGIIGVALTGFLAFLLGKSMLETKGMLWACIIHWVPDVFIFLSYVLT